MARHRDRAGRNHPKSLRLALQRLERRQLLSGVLVSPVGVLADDASISGFVYNDMDADGFRDPGEPGLAGRTVFIDADEDGVLDGGEVSTLSEADGSYQFAGLAAGTYTVAQVVEANWYQTFPASHYTVPLTSGQSVTTIYFGNAAYASVSGVMYHDLAGDMGASGDPPLAGWPVFVDLDEDGAWDGDEPRVHTDASGAYTIDGLLPGDYIVRQSLSGSWMQTMPAAPYWDLTLGVGEVVIGCDFANFECGWVYGTKWEDFDRDGVQDPGEPPIAGSLVFWDQNNNGALDGDESVSMTDANGDYFIYGLTPGTQHVRNLPDANWVQTHPLDGYAVTVTSGDEFYDLDFGEYESPSFSGIVFEDMEGDGAQDPGDPPLNNQTVFLDEDDDGVLDPGEQSTTTQGDGSYTFEGLVPGHRYQPTVVVPAGWGRSWPYPGQVYSFYLSSGQHATGKDFGLYEGATVSGDVWHDVNGDVNKQVDEPYLEGWTIYLDQDNNGALDPGEQTTTTDANGYYEFSGLAPDVYYIRQVAPSGDWLLRAPHTGRHALQLVSGFVQTGRSFINLIPATISGTKFEDTDGDGVRDPGEPGLAGWTIYLDNDGDNAFSGEPSAVTDANGDYTISGLLPGSYTVREVKQPGYYRTTPDGEGEYLVDVISEDDVTDIDFGNRPYHVVVQHVGPAGQLVTVYDLAGIVDVTADDVDVKFGKAGDVKKIGIGNKDSAAMGGVGIVVSNASAVGSVKDGRKDGGDAALFASTAPVKAVQFKSALNGLNVNGETLGGMSFGADADGDGRTDDPTAIVINGPAVKLSVDGGVTGDVLVNDADAKGFAAKAVQFKNGGFHGDMFMAGCVAKVQFGGDFASSLAVMGDLKKLDIRNGDLAGDVSTVLDLCKVSVKGGDLTGRLDVGNCLASVQVKGAKDKATKQIVGGNIVDADITVAGDLKGVKATGNLTDGHLDATTLGKVMVKGEVSATGPGCYIRAAVGTFIVRDATDALLVDTFDGEWFDGLQAYVG